MNAKELIDNMAKDALEFTDLYISMHKDELIDQDVFNSVLLKIYNYTTICFEIVLDKFRSSINENEDHIYLYDIMNAKRRFNSVMQEVENRLIYAKLEERRKADEGDAGCETQSPE